MREKLVLFKSIAEALILTLIITVSIGILSAETRNSTNYSLEIDSVNFGGGLTASDNYVQESTAGEIATGRSDSSNFSLRAGYQQMREVFVSVAVSSSTFTLSPALGGLSGGVANGSTSVTVLTDSPSGYELTISALNNPAMQQGSEIINDYLPIASPAPDFSFVTSPSDVHFGFAVEGSDVVQRYRNNGGLCDTGSFSTALTCWDGLSTAPKPIARGSANQPIGVNTNLYFQVGIGGSTAVLPGTYIATTTVTALPL